MDEKSMKQASFQLVQGHTWGEEAVSVCVSRVRNQVCVFVMYTKRLLKIPLFCKRL